MVLDPDGNPATADAPHVVNNSWTFSSPGCNLEFQLDLEALRAAGIVPVFAAGNAGPAAATSRSPANNPGAFAVGAIDDGSLVHAGSSRGPSACTQDGAPYPELVAPGVDVWTSDLFGFYASFSGTSLAAPHVTGALALLLGAKPGAIRSPAAGRGDRQRGGPRRRRARRRLRSWPPRRARRARPHAGRPAASAASAASAPARADAARLSVGASGPSTIGERHRRRR